MFFSESFTEENPPQKWRKTCRQQQLREMETTCGLLGPLGFEPEQTLLRRPRENQRDEGRGRGGETVVWHEIGAITEERSLTRAPLFRVTFPRKCGSSGWIPIGLHLMGVGKAQENADSPSKLGAR